MLVPRKLTSRILELRDKFPILSVTGPRQSGKTTLLRDLFPDYQYVSLENPDNFEFAEKDPRHFLKKYDSHVILDEAQRVPHLFNYLQGKVDTDRVMGQYILSGSQNYLLMRNITQSLAGRVALFKLFPFSFSELKSAGLLADSPEKAMFQGFYPAIFDRGLAPTDFYPNYFETYLQRDLRDLQSVQNLGQFRAFVRLCAGRIGQPINFQALGSDSGVSPVTAKSWFGLLEASHIVFTLPPYFRNFSKRISKTPKLYFYDTGLAANLLGLRSPGDIETHFSRGHLFENMIVAEFVKQQFQAGWQADLYFWQESNGREIDLLMERGEKLVIAEIKSGQTVSGAFFENLRHFAAHSGTVERSFLIYGGSENQPRAEAEVRSWKEIEGIF